jgi:hypothetical protein
MMKAWFRLGHVWLLCIVTSLLCAESARPEQLDISIDRLALIGTGVRFRMSKPSPCGC